MLNMSVNIGRFGAKIAIAGASAAAASASTVIVATGIGVGVALAGFGAYRFLSSRRGPQAPLALRPVEARKSLPSRESR